MRMALGQTLALALAGESVVVIGGSAGSMSGNRLHFE